MKKGLILLVVLLVVSCIMMSCGTSASTSTGPAASNPSVAVSSTLTAPVSTGATTTASTAQTESTPKYGGTLRIVSMPISQGIGWPATFSAAFSATQYCFETLLRCDNTGKIIPWLAESYKVADDLKSITLTLRKGIKFHDGSDFNADAVKWNLENYIVANIEPLWASVDKIYDYTVRVNFKAWDNTLPATFGDASAEAYIISKASFDKNGKDWVNQNPVGTGPFKFVSFTLDSSLKYVKNPDYWKKDDKGNQLPYLDGVEYIFASNTLTQNSMMQNGEADMIILNISKQLTDLSSMGLNINTSIDANIAMVPDSANADSPWSKKEVREAVEYAIDREGLAKAFGYGYLQPLYQVPSRGSAAYNPDFSLGRKYDVNRSKQLLAQAGYENGFETTLITHPGIDKDVAVALQAYLDKVGVKVTLDYPQIGKWVSYMGPGTWHNAALVSNLPMIDSSYAGGLQFAVNVLGQSWSRTPELKQAYQDAFSTPALDTKNISAVTDMITKDCLMIPVLESGSAMADKSYVVADYNERAAPNIWNTESAWLNK